MNKKNFRIGWPVLFARVVLFGLLSCRAKENAKPIAYDGPLQEAENVEMHYVEKSSLKTKMLAKKVLEMQNGDKDFPEGIYLEFYDELGNITSTLRANTAYYFKDDDKWRGRGKVEVKNIEKHQQLNTEELFWKPATRKIFTDMFVTIKTDEEVVYGTGLDALQDLSRYKITKPEGEFNVKE